MCLFIESRLLPKTHHQRCQFSLSEANQIIYLYAENRFKTSLNPIKSLSTITHTEATLTVNLIYCRWNIDQHFISQRGLLVNICSSFMTDSCQDVSEIHTHTQTHTLFHICFQSRDERIPKIYITVLAKIRENKHYFLNVTNLITDSKNKCFPQHTPNTHHTHRCQISPR